MTIKEILQTVATITARKDVKEYLNNTNIDTSENTVETVNSLIELTNLVINELACSYIPAITLEKAIATKGKVYYRDLLKTPLKVLRVVDESGENVPFKTFPEFISVDGVCVWIEYEYAPDKKGLDEDICYMEKDLPMRVLAYGVASEYCITEGAFDEAVMWHKRYTDGVADVCLPKNALTARRRWA